MSVTYECPTDFVNVGMAKNATSGYYTMTAHCAQAFVVHSVPLPPVPPLDFVKAGQFMSGGFFTMFIVLGLILTFRTIFKAIPFR